MFSCEYCEIFKNSFFKIQSAGLQSRSLDSFLYGGNIVVMGLRLKLFPYQTKNSTPPASKTENILTIGEVGPQLISIQHLHHVCLISFKWDKVFKNGLSKLCWKTACKKFYLVHSWILCLKNTTLKISYNLPGWPLSCLMFV